MSDAPIEFDTVTTARRLYKAARVKQWRMFEIAVDMNIAPIVLYDLCRNDVAPDKELQTLILGWLEVENIQLTSHDHETRAKYCRQFIGGVAA